MSGWLTLMLAIAAEVVGTIALKYSREFSILWPSIIVVLAYSLAFYTLSLTLQRGMSIGIAYALWSGIGTTLVTLVGVWLFKDSIEWSTVLGIAFIVSGVILLNQAGSHS